MKGKTLQNDRIWAFALVCMLLCLAACAKTPAIEPGFLPEDMASADTAGGGAGQSGDTGQSSEPAPYGETESAVPNPETVPGTPDQYGETDDTDAPLEDTPAEGLSSQTPEPSDQTSETSDQTPDLSAQTAEVSTQKAQLTIFACSSLRETLEEIAERYRANAPAVKLRFRFDGSGALLEELKEGASCDLFLSAAPAVMDALDPARIAPSRARNSDSLPRIDTDSRIDLLENRMVLAVPLDNPAGIYGFAQLATPFRKPLVALAPAGEPEGQYARNILRAFQIEDRAVRTALCVCDGEIAARLSDGLADCGVLFATDRGNFTIVDTADLESSGSITYTGAVFSDSAFPDAARAFLSYLSGPDAGAVFTDAGFTHLPTVPAPESAPEEGAA